MKKSKNITPPLEQNSVSWFIWPLLGLALLLRIPLLNGSFWLDEAAQALESSRPFVQQLMIREDFQPPLLHLIVHFLFQVNRSEWWLRVSSLSAGLITIGVTYLIAKKLTTSKIATLTVFLVSLNSFHLFYSQELRPYSLTAMFVAIGWWLSIQIAAHTTLKLKLVIALIVNSVLGLFSTYLFPFAFLGQLFYLATRRNKTAIPQAFIIGCVSTFAFLPWLPAFREQLQASQTLRTETPNWETVVSTPQIKALQLVFGKFVFGVINLDLNLIFISISLIVISLSILLLWQLRKRIGINAFMVMGCWFVLPVFSIWLVSFFIPVLQPKRVLFALPALEFVFATLVVYGSEWKKSKLAATILLMILLSTHLFGTLAYYFNKQYHRENWRFVIAEIDHQYSPTNTVVVFGFDHPFSPWEWYSHQQFATISTGTDTKTQYAQIEPSMQKALDYQNVIVFDYLTDLTDPTHFIEQYLQTYHYQPGQLFEDPNLGFVRVYTKGESFADTTQRHN